MRQVLLLWMLGLCAALGQDARGAPEPRDIGDLVPSGGERRAEASVVLRWREAASDTGREALLRFLDRSFQARDGEAYARSGASPSSRLPAEEVLRRASAARVVFFGEQHDQAGAHFWEYALLRLLAEEGGAWAVCMEMFERHVQPDLDDYLAGRIDEKAFRRRLGGRRGLWQNYDKDYRPLVEYCRAHAIPVLAGFPPRRLAARLARSTEQAFYASLKTGERALVASRITEPRDPSYRRRCLATFASMADFRRGALLAMAEKDLSRLEELAPMILGKARGGAMGRMMAGSGEKLYTAQLLKDATMAETVLASLREHPGRRVLVFAGAGHVSGRGGAVGVLETLEPSLRPLTLVFRTPRSPDGAETGGPAEADVLLFGDDLPTYVQELPERVSLEEARQRVGELRRLALLDVYRGNARDQARAEKAIEDIRGLSFRFPLCARILSEEEALEEMGDWARSREEDGELALEEKRLRAFGLLDGDASLARREEGSRRSSVMGFYRPADKALYLFPRRAGRRLWGLRVHETIHALQDQHFDLRALRRRASGDQEQAALTALVEGEAVYLMMRVLGGGEGLERMLRGGGGGHPGGGHPGRGPGEGPDRPRRPDLFRLRTEFLYRHGARFVEALVKKWGWEAVNMAFRGRLPRTSSEILHPERYLRGWAPRKVSLPAAEPPWTARKEGGLGESDLAILLRLHGTPAEEATGTAAGWEGDAYRLEVSRSDPGQWRLVYLSRWTSGEAARRAAGHLGRVFPRGRAEHRGLFVALVRYLRFE